MNRDRMEREIASVVGGRAMARSRSPDPARWSGSKVQVLLFDASKWTEQKARSWAVRHGFDVHKVHRTEHYIRIRQFDPTPGAPKRIIDFGKSSRGIRAIVEAYMQST